MSLARRILRRGPPPGALYLPRALAERGLLNWPRCARCMRAVDAYGIENETDSLIEIWAECRGTLIDSMTGRVVHGAEPKHPTMKTSVTIRKGAGWTHNRFTAIISRMALFAPDALSEGREFTQTLTVEGAKKKDTV